LPCEKLPTRDEVTKIIAEHQNAIKEIEAVNPGLVGIEIDTTTCQGKADLIFWYASHENRLEIEEIIGDETFFGIPYRLQNR
jgi:chlorite dismutase